MFDAAAVKATVWTSAPSADVKNPLEGVTPNLGAFGNTLQGKFVLIVGGIWAIVLIGIAIYFLMGWFHYSRAKKTGMHDDLGAGAEKVKTAALAFGGAVAAPALLGGIIFLVR